LHKLDFFKKAQKAYGHCAKLTIEGNKVTLVNTITGCIHPFVTGEKEIFIKDKRLLNKILEL
tara:strand:- start:645 stop:830 length:186 start_codon:yes stop_codon:yes gene_type:complete